MPTDVALALRKKNISNRTEATKMGVLLFVVPLALCLFSIGIVAAYPAFADVVALLGVE